MRADEQLSPHFWLSEFTVSQLAVRRSLANVPLAAELDNLRRLAHLLERVRELLRAPMLISSGYRSQALNDAVGGAWNSAHLDGRAADFTAPRFGTPRAICQVLERNVGQAGEPLGFDQLIYERGWVHIGIADAGVEPRGQVLSAIFTPGMPTRYARGISLA